MDIYSVREQEREDRRNKSNSQFAAMPYEKGKYDYSMAP